MPVLAGLTATGEIAFGEQTGDWEKSRETGASVNYASGPAYAAFTVYDLDDANGVGAARRNFLLGGTYDLGVVKLHALVQKSTGT